VAVLSSCRAARPSAALALHAALPIFVPTLTAGPAKPTGARPIYGNDLPRSEAGNAWANGLHFTGSLGTDDQRKLALGEGHAPPRSEEHTSELQSRENLVCRLLLEQLE